MQCIEQNWVPAASSETEHRSFVDAEITHNSLWTPGFLRHSSKTKVPWGLRSPLIKFVTFPGNHWNPENQKKTSLRKIREITFHFVPKCSWGLCCSPKRWEGSEPCKTAPQVSVPRIEGSLEVKLPTIRADEKQRWEESEKRREEERRSKRESLRRKKIQVREKVGKSRNTVFFQWFVGAEGREVGSLKRRVRSRLARSEMKNCTPLWREARFQVKMYKTHHVRSTLGSWDVKKVHAVLARSTFRSQNA